MNVNDLNSVLREAKATSTAKTFGVTIDGQVTTEDVIDRLRDEAAKLEVAAKRLCDRAMWPEQTDPFLLSAMQYLGATLISTKPVKLYAYYANEVGRYYAVDEDDLRRLGVLLADNGGERLGLTYSEWCASSPAKEKPKGWTPPQ